MSGRLDYLQRALTGKFTPIMKSVKDEWYERTGEDSFGRLSCFRHALTRWSICGKSWHIFLFPYGRRSFHISKNQIDINNPLFSIYWYRK